MPLQLFHLLLVCCFFSGSLLHDLSLVTALLLVMFSGSMSLANHRLPDPADVEVPLQVCLVLSRSFDIDLLQSFPSPHTAHSTFQSPRTLHAHVLLSSEARTACLFVATSQSSRIQFQCAVAWHGRHQLPCRHEDGTGHLTARTNRLSALL